MLTNPSGMQTKNTHTRYVVRYVGIYIKAQKIMDGRSDKLNRELTVARNEIYDR